MNTQRKTLTFAEWHMLLERLGLEIAHIFNVNRERGFAWEDEGSSLRIDVGQETFFVDVCVEPTRGGSPIIQINSNSALHLHCPLDVRRTVHEVRLAGEVMAYAEERVTGITVSPQGFGMI